MIRAIGPSLTGLGITGALADPILELHDAGGSPLLSNNDWKETHEQEISETVLAPGNDRESAILATLDPDSFIAIVRDAGGTIGVALIGVYQPRSLSQMPGEHPRRRRLARRLRR